MSWQLEPVLRCGRYVVAAIAETKTSVTVRGQRICGAAGKAPLAILVLDGDCTTIFDASGNAIAETDFQKRFPTAMEQFSELLADESK
mgnify:FL=1